MVIVKLLLGLPTGELVHVTFRMDPSVNTTGCFRFPVSVVKLKRKQYKENFFRGVGCELNSHYSYLRW